MQQLNAAADRAVEPPRQDRLAQAVRHALVGDAPADADRIAGRVRPWPGGIRMAILLAAPTFAWAAIIALGFHYLAR